MTDSCRGDPEGGEDEEKGEGLRVVPIHRRPDLLEACAALLEAQWRRGRAARLIALRRSGPDPPVSLVLLRGRGPAERLLGHARLSPVAGAGGGALLLESLVVVPEERGRGYGRALVERAEGYARCRGFSRLCLSTHDQRGFYARLGYGPSCPVQPATAAAALVPVETLLRLSGMRVDPRRGGPPPPPPPPPSSTPPAPPPPPPIVGQQVVRTLMETPWRDARGRPVFWMHKNI